MDKMIKLKIELKDIGAKRVAVMPRDVTLESLHDIIQSLFGWGDCHLWMFSNNKGKNVWQPPTDDSGFYEELDPSEFSVEDLLQKVGDHAEYEYDFGDSWRHRITRMADPKPGEKYGCVKSEGPDGEEDSRFSFGGAGRSHVPALDEVNGRMPALKSLSRLGVQVELSEKMNGGKGPGIMDILDAMSADDLKIAAAGLPGTQGLSEAGLKERLGDFLSSEEGRTVAVESLVMSITKPYFNALSKAAKSGSAVMEDMDIDAVGVFSKSPVTHVQRSGMRDVRLFIANEVREMWPKMCLRWCSLHRDWDTVHALADAAIRLYGGISVHDFAGILGRFYEKNEYTEQLLEGVMGVRASCWDAFHFVEEGIIYGDKFDTLLDYREFARKRDAYPRWETRDFKEFYAYADERYFEDTPQREALVGFLMKTFGDSRKTAEGVTDEIQCSIVEGDSADEIAGRFAVNFLNPDMSRRKVAEIRELVSDVRDNMRLGEYNGNTFFSTLQSARPAMRSAAKVGRNDPCPCGSGLKYKKCCGKQV